MQQYNTENRYQGIDVIAVKLYEWSNRILNYKNAEISLQNN